MNNKTATRLLKSYRSDGSDANDPVFKDALKQTRQDPGLGKWFVEEQALDEAIASQLNSIAVPGSLRDDILAMGAVHEQARPRLFRRWRGGGMLAMAAALLVLLGGGWLWMYRQPSLSFEHYPRVATGFMRSQFELEMVTSDLIEAKGWVEGRGLSRELPIPASLAQATNRGVGCAPFDWRGEQVLLLCFWLEDGTALHYFVMDADALPDPPAPGEMRMARYRGYQTVTWQEDGFALVLTTSNFDLDTRTLLLNHLAGSPVLTGFPAGNPIQWETLAA